MASGVGYSLMKPGSVCRPTDRGSDIWLVSSWRSSDVAGFRLADQPEKRQVGKVRLRASGSQVQDAPACSHERKPGRLSRRCVLGVSAICIQPMLAWSSTASTADFVEEELNESQKIFESFLESLKERLKGKLAVAPTTPPGSEPDPGAQSVTESLAQTAAEARELTVGGSEAGENLEPADVSASVGPAEGVTPLDPGEYTAAGSSESVPADSSTPTPGELAEVRGYEPLSSLESSSVPSKTGETSGTGETAGATGLASESVVPGPVEEAFSNLAQKVEEAFSD